MHVRPLIRSDIPRVLEISGACFSSDELFRWMYPHQDRYPNDLRRYQLVRLRTRLVQQGGQGYVAETEAGCGCKGCSGEDGGRIVGFGFFIREGRDEAARKWRAESWTAKFERYLLSWDVWYEMTFLQRANDPRAQAQFARVTKYGFYEVLDDYWLLGLLGVDPSCRRRGIGRMIVEHGLSIAAEEKVPVTLEASILGRKLYQEMGFQTIQKSAIVDGGEDLKEGVAMLWEPMELKGKWLQEGSDGTKHLKSPQ